MKNYFSCYFTFIFSVFNFSTILVSNQRTIFYLNAHGMAPNPITENILCSYFCEIMYKTCLGASISLKKSQRWRHITHLTRLVMFKQGQKAHAGPVGDPA